MGLGAWFSAMTLAATHGWIVAVAAALAVTWMLNLYNFMDGSDGMAGGMALIGFSCYGATAWVSGNEAFAIANFCIAAAAAAFLLFNFHPARIFMGDAGSIPLGFLAAALGMTGWMNGCWPMWFPVLVFSPFIVDASVTLIKRGLRGEKVWRAHREHYYQRLVRSGLGHRNTALIGYILMSASALSALWAARQHTSVQFGMVAAWIAVYLIMLPLCDRRLRHGADDS
jgi:UDP-N-acetylmuramyl pentapeptide phosphotransferase/UDP-N-acetylglucosamine-1-phosphate transferase